MLTLACGSCGVSALSMGFPPFHAWIVLLPVAFVAFHFAAWRGGQFKFGTLLGHLLGTSVAFVAAVVMLAGLVIPIAFLVAVLGLLTQLRVDDKWARMVTGGVLLCFVISAGWTYRQARSQGKFWKLGRLHAGAPAQDYTVAAVKENLFSNEELLQLVQSEEPALARNAGKIVERKLAGDDRFSLGEFAQELDVLQKSGKVTFEPEVVRAYRSILESLSKETSEKTGVTEAD